MLTIIQASPHSCKIHHLASELQLKGLLPDLDNDANKALFKRNFLLMNALYQLQGLLLPDFWLQVQALNIQLLTQLPTDMTLRLEQDTALRGYYLDWSHFDISADKVEDMLSHFWGQYQEYINPSAQAIDNHRALQIFELDNKASQQDIRRQWRKLALKYHPDRAFGNAEKFRQVCGAWQKLRV